MRWHLATNEQLEVIFNHEYDLPNCLLVDLVVEMLNRRLFDGMIIELAKRFAVDRDEAIQAGYMAVYQLAKIYKAGKLSFKSMCFIAIERRLKGIILKQYQKRNSFNRSLESLQKLKESMRWDIPDNTDVESHVIRWMTYEEKMKQLTKKERNIVEWFINGYSINYIAKQIYRVDPKLVHYHFRKALKKLNLSDFEVGARTGLKTAGCLKR